MPMTQIAVASGFGSLRRFNEVFQDLFRRPPSALRRKTVAKPMPAEPGVSLKLRYRPPYDWDAILRFFQLRAIRGVEIVEDGKYLRTVEIGGKTGSIEVCHLPKQNSLGLRIQFPDVRSFPAIVARDGLAVLGTEAVRRGSSLGV